MPARSRLQRQHQRLQQRLRIGDTFQHKDIHLCADHPILRQRGDVLSRVTEHQLKLQHLCALHWRLVLRVARVELQSKRARHLRHHAAVKQCRRGRAATAEVRRREVHREDHVQVALDDAREAAPELVLGVQRDALARAERLATRRQQLHALLAPSNRPGTSPEASSAFMRSEKAGERREGAALIKDEKQVFSPSTATRRNRPRRSSSNSSIVYLEFALIWNRGSTASYKARTHRDSSRGE
mmetsp:Transcript_105151/g.206239  ORF Transcript_105151/g.206239 Transcript_105151/m.206239 type:complete len:241 (-) Transcript_105151:864-1586(-)